MPEFSKVHRFKKTAEGHLNKIKKLGGKGHIVIEKSKGKTAYIVVYSYREKTIKEKQSKK